jgi:hypothetical protein
MLPVFLLNRETRCDSFEVVHLPLSQPEASERQRGTVGEKNGNFIAD